MTQTMDLNKMELAPMSELEMEDIDGGFIDYVRITFAGIHFFQGLWAGINGN